MIAAGATQPTKRNKFRNTTLALPNASRTLQKSKRKVQGLVDPSVGEQQNGSRKNTNDQGNGTKKMKLDDDVSES
jgi:hypothetical protein